VFPSICRAWTRAPIPPPVGIGKTPNPLAGMIFHYDPHSTDTICEAAYLATHIPVTVLVSPSNLWRMKELYAKVPGAADSIDVLPLLLKEKHLNTQRMLRLMAFSDTDGAMPLYMEVSKQPFPNGLSNPRISPKYSRPTMFGSEGLPFSKD